MEHHSDCDQQHTLRQPCNAALTGGAGAVVIDAALVNGASASSAAEYEAAPREEFVRPAIATQEMPAPSPRVLRAWEDTAAAVGATATQAPPPHPIVEAEAVEGRGWFQGHATLIAIAAATAFALLLLVRRRSRRHRPQPTLRGLKEPAR